jgi:tetratricopeptide (TPR) repeat protein
LYAETERWDEAATDFERVLEVDPDNLAWLILRGQALLMLGRYEDSLAPLDRAVELDESQSLSYGFRGAVRYMLRDEPGALADLGRAVELAPGWDWAQSLLAETLLLSGRNDEALAASEAAVELAPEDNWHRYVRALARGSAGDPEGAQADLNAAIHADEEAGSRSPRELLNLALWRLARDAPRDVEVAERVFGEVAPESEAHRSEVIRDLETLGRVRGSETATRIAGALAGETRSPVSATPG